MDWAKAAARVDRLLEAEPIAWYRAGDPSRSLTVAVSGGCDSTCLLLLTAHLRRHDPDSVTVIHFDHRVRSEEAGVGERRHLEELSSGLGIRFRTGAVRFPDESTDARGADIAVDATWVRGGPPSEQQLRDARMEFYRRAQEAIGSDILLQGHHADDVAEGIIMRWLRGSGLEGLATPRPEAEHRHIGVIVRPLLRLRKSVLQDALTNAGIAWKEDQSNAVQRHLRNRIRHRALPLLEDLSDRSVVEALGRTHQLLLEDADALDAAAESVLRIESGVWCLAKTGERAPAILRRALYRFLHREGDRRLVPGARAVDGIVRELAARRPFRVSLDDRSVLESDGARIRIVEATPAGAGEGDREHALAVGDTVHWLDGRRLTAERIRRGEAVWHDDSILNEIDPTTTCLVSGSLEPQLESMSGRTTRQSPLFHVRQWRPGDRYRPLNAPGRKKLQDLFTDASIPREERLCLPVVYTGQDEIVWVPGFPPAHQFALSSASRKAVRLTYCRG